jgi:hypothetical protein
MHILKWYENAIPPPFPSFFVLKRTLRGARGGVNGFDGREA